MSAPFNKAFVSLRSKNHHETLVNGLWKLYQDNRGTDFSFRWGTKFVSAHQLIIDIFIPKDRLVICGLSVSGNLIDDIDPLLEFLYRGTVTVPKERLARLLQVASRLRFTLLTQAIQLSMRQSTNCDNSTPVTVTTLYHQAKLIRSLWTLFNTSRDVDFVVEWAGAGVRAHLIVVHVFLSTDRIFEAMALGPGIWKTIDVGGNLERLMEFLYKGTVDVETVKLPNLLLIARELGFRLLVTSISSWAFSTQKASNSKPNEAGETNCTATQTTNAVDLSAEISSEENVFDTSFSIFSSEMPITTPVGHEAEFSNVIDSAGMPKITSVRGGVTDDDHLISCPSSSCQSGGDSNVVTPLPPSTAETADDRTMEVAAPDFTWLASAAAQPIVLLEQLQTYRCRLCKYQTHLGDSKGFRAHRAAHRNKAEIPALNTREHRRRMRRDFEKESSPLTCTFTGCSFRTPNREKMMTHEMQNHLKRAPPGDKPAGVKSHPAASHSKESLSVENVSEKSTNWCPPKSNRMKPPTLVVPPYRNEVDGGVSLLGPRNTDLIDGDSNSLEKPESGMDTSHDLIRCSKVNLPFPSAQQQTSAAAGDAVVPIEGAEQIAYLCGVCEDSFVGYANFQTHMKGHILS